MFAEIEKLSRNLERLSFPDEEISQGDFNDWLNHPITQVLLAELKLQLLERGLPLVYDQPTDEQAKTQETLMRGEHNAFLWLINWEPKALELKKESEK